MEKDLIAKIQRIINRSRQISEDELRSLMILVRKRLELEPEPERVPYVTLNLFCNWAAHTQITESLTGLRILGRINDALVKVKSCSETERIQTEVARAIGFDELYSEFVLFLDKVGVKHELRDKRIWAIVLKHLIEIIRDVPLAFPAVGKLKRRAQKIYNHIAQNPIKPGAGVVLVAIFDVDYDRLGAKGIGTIVCLRVKTEDTTEIIIPLTITL